MANQSLDDLLPKFDPKKVEDEAIIEENPMVQSGEGGDDFSSTADALGRGVEGLGKLLFDPTNEGAGYEDESLTKFKGPRDSTGAFQLDVEGLDAARSRNDERYSSAGEPVLGIEGAPHIMKKLDAEGDQYTEFVMPPDLVSGNNPVGESIGRMGLSTVTKMAKGAASFGEFLLDSVKQSRTGEFDPDTADPTGFQNLPAEALIALGEIVDGWLGSGISDEYTNWVDQNFPTMPTANNAENFVSDTVSMGAGGMAGAKLAKGTVGKVIDEFFKRAKDINPDSAKAAAQVFTKAALATVPGEAAGVTMMGPDESITGNAFLDNFILGGAFAGLGGIVGGVGRIADKYPLAGFNRGARKEDALANFILKLDPTATQNMTKEEAVRRGRILGGIVSQNADFTSGKFKTPNDTIMALVQGDGARQYIQAVAGRQLSPEELDGFTQQLVSNMRGIKKGRVQNNSQVIADADARMDKNVETYMEGTANEILDKPFIPGAMTNLAEPEIGSLQAAKTEFDRAGVNAKSMESALLAEQNDNTLFKALDDYRSTDPLAFNTEGRDAFEKMAQEGLPNQWKKEHEAYNNLYKAIPADPYDYAALADEIIEAGRGDTALEALKYKPGQRTIEKIEGLGATPEDAALDMAQKRAALIEGLRTEFPDINALWNKGRSTLSREVDQGIKANAKGGNVDVSQGRMVRNAIDEIVGKSTNPAVKAANDAYAAFKQKWNKTGQLEELDEQMRVYNNRSQVVPQQTSQHAWQHAIFEDDTGLELQPLFDAMGDKNVPANVKEYAVGQLFTKIARGMSADDLTKNLQPHLNLIRNVNPAMEQDFIATIGALRKAEIGSSEATAALANAQKIASETMQIANNKELSAFITGKNILGGETPAMTTGIEKTMSEIFNSKDGAGKVQRLIQEARDANNPMVEQAVRSHAVRWLKEKMLSSHSTGTTALGGEVNFSHAARLGALKNIVEGSDNNVLQVLKTAFGDDTASYNAIRDVLEHVYTKTNLDQADTFVKGSNTQRNQASALDSTRTLIIAKWGPLSREGTIAGRIANLVLGDNSAKIEDILANYLDLMIVNPNLLKDIANASKGRDMGGAEYLLRGANAAAKTILYGIQNSEYKNAPIDEQTSDAFNLNGKFTNADLDDTTNTIHSDSIPTNVINETFDALGGADSVTSNMMRKTKGRPVSTNIEDRRAKTMNEATVPKPKDIEKFKKDSFARPKATDYPAPKKLSKGAIDSPSSKGFSKKPNG